MDCPLCAELAEAVEKTKTRAGHRVTTLRWSVSLAAGEFNFDHGTILKRLKAASQLPGDDGFYSTAQIALAVYGDLAGERLRKLREEADGEAMDNAYRRKELGETKFFILFLADVAQSVVQHIKASQMSDQEKDDTMEEIARSFDEAEILRKICPQL